MSILKTTVWSLLGAVAATTAGCSGQWTAAKVGDGPGLRFEQRDKVSYLRGPYNFDFYRRHNEAYRFGAAIHFAHGKAHDVPQLTPLDRASHFDKQFDAEAVHWVFDLPRIQPVRDGRPVSPDPLCAPGRGPRLRVR